MKRLFFDIETLPAAEDKHPVIREIYDRKAQKRKGLTKEFEEFLEDTVFSGTFGRILCISYAINDEPVQCIFGDEKETLKRFWDVARDVDLFVGHNIFDFDMRFLYQRSIVYAIRPTQDIPFIRYRNAPMYDIMHEWTKWNPKGWVTLDEMARALGIKSSKEGELDGSKVHEFYKKGKLQEIYDYCNADVEVTRAIYKRMMFMP